MPCNVFSKHDNFSIEHGHVLPGLMHKCYLAKQKNVPFVIWASGKPLRQFIYSGDLARLMLWYLLDSDKLDPLIIATDPKDEVSIEQAANLVAEVMEFNGEIVLDGSKADGQLQKTCTNAGLRSMRPDFRFTPIRQAFVKTATWFSGNYYDTCRKLFDMSWQSVIQTQRMLTRQSFMRGQSCRRRPVYRGLRTKALLKPRENIIAAVTPRAAGREKNSHITTRRHKITASINLLRATFRINGFKRRLNLAARFGRRLNLLRRLIASKQHPQLLAAKKGLEPKT